jgi:hypothetical protein
MDELGHALRNGSPAGYDQPVKEVVMTDQPSPQQEVPGPQIVECGGLRFDASFRAPAGATLRVYGEVDGQTTELLRFDDFIEAPHYHVPAAGPAIAFDEAVLGEPLAWFVSQLSQHLAELLTEAGFARTLPDVDPGAVAHCADAIRKAMETCVPDGYTRVPGAGLRRSPA